MTTAFEKFKDAIQETTELDKLITQKRVIQMEIDTLHALQAIRRNFNDIVCQDKLILRFFFSYDLMPPEEKAQFRVSMGVQGRRILDMWAFTGLPNFPFRDEVLGMYMASMAHFSDEDVVEHLVQATELMSLVDSKIAPSQS